MNLAIVYLSLALWVAAMIGFFPSALRYALGPYNLLDSYRTALFFMAVLWVVGLGRLVFFPSNESARTGVLALSCAVAIYLLALAAAGAKR